MLEFAWPWLLTLLPLPIIIRLFPAIKRTQIAALKLPKIPINLQQLQQQQRVQGWQIILLPLVIWCCLVVAVSRPQWLGDPVTLPKEGRDLMLAVDLSGSMEYEDMLINGEAVNRLQMIQYVLADFIQRRVGDRLGLILFADTAYLQTPLTHDRETVAAMLSEAVIGLVGDKTAIGDAIGLAAKRFDKQQVEHKVLVLLTDGQNTAGNISPEDALKLAKNKKITIYPIGIGADELFIRSFFGKQRVNPSQDLDENLLRNLANETGGQYFRARSPQDLAEIYTRLDQLEPIAKDAITLRPLSALFYWPLGIAFILTLLFALFRLAPQLTTKQQVL